MVFKTYARYPYSTLYPSLRHISLYFTNLAVSFVSGAGSLFGWSRNRESTTALDGGLGGLMAVAGLVLLIWPGLLVNLIPVAGGIGILVHGVTNLFKALELKKAGYSAWVTPLVLAVLSILGGIFILSNPMGMIKSIFRVIGIVLIYNGLTSLYISSRNS